MPTCTIQHPGLYTLPAGEGKHWRGGSQQWYSRYWQKQAGCGPTNCATLLWYLAATRPGCAALAPMAKHATKEGFLQLMEAVWPFVTPGFMGVNRTSVFCRGAKRYGKSKGVPLRCNALELRTPGAEETAQAAAFLQNAFERDLPVAFLSLAGSEEKAIENWHWMTLIAFNADTLHATMLDGGGEKQVDFGLWLHTRKGRGGLVTIEPEQG